MRNLILSIMVASAIALSGCGSAQLNCPSDHVVTATFNAPNGVAIAGQLAQVIGPLAMMAAGKAPNGLKAVPTAPSTTSNDGTLTVSSLPLILGSSSYSCGSSPTIVPAP